MSDAFDLESSEPLETADVAEGEPPPPPPTKQRPGDQPLPVVNDRTDVQTLMIREIEKRREIGIERYGTPLQPFNGRDAAQDLFEEMIDGAAYALQIRVELEELAAQVKRQEAEIYALRAEKAALMAEMSADRAEAALRSVRGY